MSLFDKVSEDIKTAMLAREKEKLEKTISEKFKEETSDQIKTLQKELDEKSVQVKELNKTKAEIEKLKREKDEQLEKIALEKEREYTEKLAEEKLKLKEQLNDYFQTNVFNKCHSMGQLVKRQLKHTLQKNLMMIQKNLGKRSD